MDTSDWMPWNVKLVKFVIPKVPQNYLDITETYPLHL